MKTFVLICDLKNEPEAIEAYVRCHAQVDAAILESIRAAGILEMSIYRWAQRLSMILVTSDDFSFEKKAALDLANPKVQEWEALMWKFQQALPNTPEGTKWVLMEKIYDLNRHK